MLENKLFNLIIENIDFYIPNKRKLKISNLYCLKLIYKVLKTGPWVGYAVAIILLFINDLYYGQNIN